MSTTLRRHAAVVTFLLASIFLFSLAAVLADTDVIDLKTLAKKARPAVMLLVVKDAKGEEIATGTGFLVSSDGKLFTNLHVLKKGAGAVAKSENGDVFSVEGILAADAKNDLVLLQIKGKDLPFLTLATSDKAEVGTRVAVIGSPLGLEGTLSEGIVSAVRRLVGEKRMLQITAAISPGSSGSPVLNGNAEVLGVATLIVRGGQGLNFAVPQEVARSLLAKAKESPNIQPLGNIVIQEDDKMLSDPEWKAVDAAETAEDYVTMLKHSQTLVQRYPDSSLAYNYLGTAYFKLKFYPDAIAAFLKAIKLKEDDVNSWIGLGAAYEQAGRIAEAIAACQQAIKVKADDEEAWSCLGSAYMKAGRTEDAIAAHRQVTKLKPDDVLGWTSLGSTYWQADRPSDAITAYQQATKLKPKSAEVWIDLGSVCCQAGRTVDAIIALERATKLRQDDAVAWEWLGSAYEQASRRTEAIAAYKRAIKLKPDFAEPWCNLGWVYIMASRWTDARTALQQATKLKPDYAEAWGGLGVVHMNARRWSDAIAAFHQAIKLKPSYPDAWYGLGMAYYGNRQLLNAFDAQRQLEKLNPALASELNSLILSGRR